MITEDKNLRNLFAQTPEMFCILSGPEHTFEFVNEAHIKVLGFDATGKTVRDAQPESVEVHGILDEVYRTGVTAHLHEIPVTVGKSLRYFDLTYSARTDQTGLIVGIMILGSEVTNKVFAASQIKLMHESIPQVIWTADPAGNLNYTNARWTAYSSSEKPEEWINFVHPDDVDRVSKIWSRSIQTGEPYETEFRLRRIDGVYHWFLVRASAIKDQNGNITQWYGTCTDIESHRSLLTELEAERELRDQFVSMLTHDLRNPLSAAKISAQIIMRIASQPDKVTSGASRIVENINRANKLIENLLDANKIKAGGKLQLEMEPVGLNSLVDDVLVDLATVHGDRFVVATNKEAINGHWSSEGIRRIMENLCNNAVKYGDERSPIQVTLEQNNKSVKIDVHNYGSVISEEDQKKLFDPYQRTVTVAQGTITGWGLGLTLVRGVAEAHGGMVEVKSNSSDGTTFSVLIPLDSRVKT